MFKRFAMTYWPKCSRRKLLLVVTLLTAARAAAQPGLPQTCSPALERGARALAEARVDAAKGDFEEVLKDDSSPPFVRGLALQALAETALTGKDATAATAVWRRMSNDASLPQLQRDLARRRIVEEERRQKGLPARDPADFRALLPALPEASAAFHVAPAGNDAGDGSEGKPFGTLVKARDAVRALRKSNGGSLPKGGVRILIAGGAYHAEQTFKLTAEDSGTAEAPVVYGAKPGQTPVFGGGRPIQGWKPIADAALGEKLDPSIRGKVLEADLAANGVVNWGDPTALKHRPELFANGSPQTLARWPNDTFVKTGEVLGKDTFKEGGSIGCRDGVFRFLEDRQRTWVDEPDVRLYGYWFWDWYEEYQKVASIDAENRSFTLAKPYSGYGYRKDQRYYAVNVLRELDSPGEWYLDRRSGEIYWLPPANLETAKAITVLSVCEDPFVTMDDVSHVILLGLTFQEGRGDGIHVQGGADCLVAACTLRRFGGDAVVVQGGHHHGVFGCVMQTLGCGGMQVNGGDRQTLSPGGHFVENCTVSDISRIKRTYAPAVHMDGCGNRVAHNLFERIPSSAMRIEGNDHLIELNVIRNVVRESDDQGGIDMFGNPLYRGVVIRWNRWSDIQGGTHCGAAGIRLDDMISGIAVHGNLFERCGAVLFGGVQIHGGKDNLVDGNVFIDCRAGLSFSRWDEARWLKGIEGSLQQASREPYASRYPDLARLKTGANVNYVSRNLMVRCQDVFTRDGGVERSVLNQASDAPIAPEVLSGENAGDARLRQILFDPIPVNEMGPYAHPWRARPALGN